MEATYFLLVFREIRAYRTSLSICGTTRGFNVRVSIYEGAIFGGEITELLFGHSFVSEGASSDCQTWIMGSISRRGVC